MLFLHIENLKLTSQCSLSAALSQTVKSKGNQFDVMVFFFIGEGTFLTDISCFYIFFPDFSSWKKNTQKTLNAAV